ncbi:hypothetical protein GmHk_17G049930 [Glycine max]|nr:hypothetical protein GmHk_17G049930 [Glycine max]
MGKISEAFFTLAHCLIALWTYYGIIKDGEYLVITQLVTTQLALQRESCNGVVGVIGVGLNIVRYSSPLSVMKT